MKHVVLRTSIIATVFVFIGLNFVMWAFSGRSLATTYFFIYPALGLVLGFINWWINEIRFEKFLAYKRSSFGTKPLRSK